MWGLKSKRRFFPQELPYRLSPRKDKYIDNSNKLPCTLRSKEARMASGPRERSP